MPEQDELPNNGAKVSFLLRVKPLAFLSDAILLKRLPLTIDEGGPQSQHGLRSLHGPTHSSPFHLIFHHVATRTLDHTTGNRITRRGNAYAVGVFTGRTTYKDRAAQSPTLQTRPLIFVDMNIDKQRFLKTFGSNHVLAVEGNLKPELVMLSGLLGIDCIDYDLADVECVSIR